MRQKMSLLRCSLINVMIDAKAGVDAEVPPIKRGAPR